MNSKNKWLFPILWVIVLIIGIYLISTMQIITKDGTSYIEQAQFFQTDLLSAIKSHYCGYPFLIFLVHKIASVFGLPDGINGWIISAQSAALMCMLAAYVVLYFICKSFLGKEKAVYALLILAFLPYPMKFATDVLRDWPYVLFLSFGLITLTAAAKGKKWPLYGVSGFLTGLGYFIRVECIQIAIYALIWLSVCTIWPRYYMTRKKAVLSACLFLFCFAAAVVPYMHIRQQFVPEKFKEYFNESSVGKNLQMPYTAGMPADFVKSVTNVIERTAENLFYYSFVFAIIGFYVRYKKYSSQADDIEKIFVSSFIVLNFVMLVWLSCNFNYVSRRHCLPLSLLLLFYSPIGMSNVAEKLNFLKFKLLYRFYLLLIIGILICLPALLISKRKDIAGFIEAAKWLGQNTSPQAMIAVPDPRINFYAQRKGIQAWEKKDMTGADFAVVKIKSDDASPDLGEEMAWFWVDAEKKNSKLVIYRLP